MSCFQIPVSGFTPLPVPLQGISVFGSLELPYGSHGTVNVVSGGETNMIIVLPANPYQGQTLTFKDVSGIASSYPITIMGHDDLMTNDLDTPLTGDNGVLINLLEFIDDKFTYTLFQDFQAVELYWTGTDWGMR